MDKNWLQSKLTIEEAEAKHIVYDKRLGEKGVPFGFINEDWKAMIAGMESGDELWEFSSPAATWQNLSGREGIALVRNGEVIDTIITRLN